MKVVLDFTIAAMGSKKKLFRRVWSRSRLCFGFYLKTIFGFCDQTMQILKITFVCFYCILILNFNF